RRNGGGRELVDVLAVRLYVLDQALDALTDDVPEDVFVRIRPAQERPDKDTTDFAKRLGDMYRAWGARRGMTVRNLASSPERIDLAVAGLGAGKILLDEAGLHLLERVE